MHLIWFAIVLVIWKEINDRIFRGKENSFRGKENSHVQLIENMKLLFFWWVKAKYVVLHYNFHNWCQNPFLCAGIG